MAVVSRLLWLLQAFLGGVALTVLMIIMIALGCAALAALVGIIVFATT